jgi:DnaJ-class molecular chaperone
MDEVRNHCTSCNGNGYVRGSLGNTGTCIFCAGTGLINRHQSRTKHQNFWAILRMCEDLINGKETKGRYH